MFKSCGAARFAYNWALSLINKNYEETKKFLKIGDLRKQFTELRAGNEFKWLKNIKGMLKNKHLSKAIAEQCFNMFQSILKYKCEWNRVCKSRPILSKFKNM